MRWGKQRLGPLQDMVGPQMDTILTSNNKPDKISPDPAPEPTQLRCGTVSPRCTAGRATNAASARVTWVKSCMPTKSPAW